MPGSHRDAGEHVGTGTLAFRSRSPALTAPPAQGACRGPACCFARPPPTPPPPGWDAPRTVKPSPLQGAGGGRAEEAEEALIGSRSCGSSFDVGIDKDPAGHCALHTRWPRFSATLWGRWRDPRSLMILELNLKLSTDNRPGMGPGSSGVQMGVPSPPSPHHGATSFPGAPGCSVQGGGGGYSQSCKRQEGPSFGRLCQLLRISRLSIITISCREGPG